MSSPFVAIEFLTRIRLRPAPGTTMDDVARSQAWFAAVGLLIGGLLCGIDWLASRALPDEAVAALTIVALAAITGALHLDGLGDTADGLFGGASPQRRLEIMRDVHAGSFAVVAIVSVLLLKYAALVALPDIERRQALLLAPCVARAALVAVVALFPYARADGMGATFRDHAAPLALLVATATTVTASLVVFGAAGLLVAASGAATALAVGAYATRLIGGVTGDVYGAAVEVTEAATLLFIAALAGRAWL